MANLTIQVRVGTLQRKVCICLVIECGLRPLLTVMAIIALSTDAALVNIVSYMTR